VRKGTLLANDVIADFIQQLARLRTAGVGAKGNRFLRGRGRQKQGKTNQKASDGGRTAMISHIH
jgi:hypothetical protein